MVLTAAKTGEKVIIKKITGGGQARSHLLGMGLRIGDKLEVISNQGQGQLAVAADSRRYVLGHGLAKKIIVQGSEST